MAYTLNQIFKEKAARANANESNNDFISSFLTAGNKSILELNRIAFASGNTVGTIDGDTGLDERYHPSLSAGIDYNLDEGSIWKISNPATPLINVWEVKLRQAQSFYFDDNTPNGVDGDPVT